MWVYKEADLGDFDLTCVAAKFSPRSKFVGATFYDGTKGVVKIFDVMWESIAWEFRLEEGKWNIYNGICWRPSAIDDGAVLVAVDTEGCVTKFNTETGEKEEIKTEFPTARFNCIDYATNGNLYVTGGDDKIVRFFDDSTNQLITESDSYYTKNHSHSNRVFTSWFLPGSSDVCLTAGWDMNIIIHDVR